VRVRTSRGANAAAQRKSPSKPKTSAWACSEKNDPICSAWPDARHSPHPVEGQPREISIITLGERLDVDLKAAEHPRDEHPVEAGAEELGVGLLRVARVAFGLLLAFEEGRAHGLCAGDELGW
jgi:hypothetical protein